MARGWEKEDAGPPEKAEPTPVDPKIAERAAERVAERDKKVKLQALHLQRERILSERTSSPHRRSALEAALLEIEERLTELGWSVHL